MGLAPTGLRSDFLDRASKNLSFGRLPCRKWSISFPKQPALPPGIRTTAEAYNQRKEAKRKARSDG